MKICAIICEFNPFHNGHKYLIERAKVLSGCDAVLCVMSGSFTQRGEICVQNKLDRARHAVLNGADCVIELPTAFSVAPAEIFAKGAIKLINAITSAEVLAFGCEDDDPQLIMRSAKILLSEGEKFRNALAEKLGSGESYIRAYTAAFGECGGNARFLSRPNNLLAVEYAKAVLSFKSRGGYGRTDDLRTDKVRTFTQTDKAKTCEEQSRTLDILPIKRVGAEHGETELKNGISSAEAIRKNPRDPLARACVPPCVFDDLGDISAQNKLFYAFLNFKLLQTQPQTLARIYGCSEGLENKIISCADMPAEDIIKNCSGKRYSNARIRRILTANLLELYADDCARYLKSPLYIKPLAVKKDRADEILNALSSSAFPLIMRKKDEDKLCGDALKCYKSDLFAYKIHNFIGNFSGGVCGGGDGGSNAIKATDFGYCRFV